MIAIIHINIFKNLAGGGEFTSTITVGGEGSNVEIHELNIGGSYGNSGTKLFSNGDIKSDGSLTVDDESTFKSNLTIYGNILAGKRQWTRKYLRHVVIL